MAQCSVFPKPPAHRIVLEADPTQIAARVSMKTEGGAAAADVPITEQAFSQALSTAKSITRSLLK